MHVSLHSCAPQPAPYPLQPQPRSSPVAALPRHPHHASLPPGWSACSSGCCPTILVLLCLCPAAVAAPAAASRLPSSHSAHHLTLSLSRGLASRGLRWRLRDEQKMRQRWPTASCAHARIGWAGPVHTRACCLLHARWTSMDVRAGSNHFAGLQFDTPEIDV